MKFFTKIIKHSHKKRRGRAGDNYKSPMESWAEKEVELACKRENPNWTQNCGDWDYGVSCYQSALTAYKSLISDDHSGMSWQLTTNILTRLCEHKPLTPITDEDFVIYDNSVRVPKDYLEENKLKSEIQCTRMSSLFRSEHLDGTITYTDVDRYFCYEVDNPDIVYSGGGAARIVDKMFPITMPYYPPENRYRICCETFLVDKEMGDFDTVAYWTITTPDNNIVEVNKFFKEVKDGDPITETLEYEHLATNELGELVTKTDSKESTYQPTKFVEISQEEFGERRKNKIS